MKLITWWTTVFFQKLNCGTRCCVGLQKLGPWIPDTWWSSTTSSQISSLRPLVWFLKRLFLCLLIHRCWRHVPKTIVLQCLWKIPTHCRFSVGDQTSRFPGTDRLLFHWQITSLFNTPSLVPFPSSRGSKIAGSEFCPCVTKSCYHLPSSASSIFFFFFQFLPTFNRWMAHSKVKVSRFSANFT